MFYIRFTFVCCMKHRIHEITQSRKYYYHTKIGRANQNVDMVTSKVAESKKTEAVDQTLQFLTFLFDLVHFQNDPRVYKSESKTNVLIKTNLNYLISNICADHFQPSCTNMLLTVLTQKSSKY